MALTKFCLIVDTEADFWRFIPSPHFKRKDLIKWKINAFINRYSKGRAGIKNVVKMLKKHRFPTTFTIVGHLYLEECNGFPHFGEILPEAKWMIKLMNKKWNYWDPASNYTAHPGVYLGDFIKKEMKVPYFDLGLHAFTHEALTLEKEEIVESCIESAVTAAKSISIRPVSFGAPFNMLEDVNEPKKVYTILKKNGIKIVRFAGQEDKFKQTHSVKIKDIFNKFGLKAIHVSHYFEGNSTQKLIKRIVKEIKESINKKVVYCLNTHDFTHKNTSNLEFILREVLKLKNEGKIKIVNMKKLLE